MDGEDATLPADPSATPLGDQSTAADATQRGRGSGEDRLTRGDVIGRYVVLERLGAGGMGVVYAAYDPELDRKVAVKLILPGRSSDDARTRLQREAQAMAKVSHPNVITVHDVGEVGQHVFVCMEFIEGKTLKDATADPSGDWRATLAPYLEAARGLAAAHRAGLVHRDFKPENVMVGDDGRVRVLDFGLARPIDEKDGHDLRPEEMLATQKGTPSSIDLLNTPLTRTGALVGTPAYMAPEQHLGLPTDAKTDQFSFCVALYRALYQEHPFEADNVAALSLAVTEGRIRSAPTNTSVPSWIRDVLLRGLQTVPDDRFESMEALVEQLARDPERARGRRVRLAGLLLVVAGGAAGMAGLVAERSDVCGGSAGLIEESWNASRADAIGAAFADTGLSYAPTSWEHARELLDTYAASWADGHRDACEDHQRQEQSESLLDRRMACLEGRRRELEGVLGVLEDPDPEVVDNAVEMAASLPSLERCADAETLLAAVPPPEDPATLAEVERIRGELARAHALHGAGHYEDELREAKAALQAAEALDYVPIRAEASLRVGIAEAGTDAVGPAEQHVSDALWAALSVGHDEVAVEAAIQLVYVLSSLRARYDEALRWAKAAEALVERTDATPMVRADLLARRGSLHHRRGEHAEARELYDQSIALVREHAGDEHPALAIAYHAMGAISRAEGKYDDAIDGYTRALEVAEHALGPEHPTVASSLSARGEIYVLMGELEKGRTDVERALNMRIEILGPEHASTGSSYGTMADLAKAEAKYDEALKHLERQLEIYERVYGPKHPDVATTMDALAGTVGRMGDYQRALELRLRALEIRKAVLDPEHDNLAASYNNLGGVYSDLGRFKEAIEHYEKARDLIERKHGRTHPNVGGTLLNIGDAARLDDDLVKAKESLEEAQEILTEALGADHLHVAFANHNLAEVLVEQGRDEEAAELFERVLETFQKQLGPQHPHVAAPLRGLGLIDVRARRYDAGIEKIDRALSIYEASGGAEPHEQASLRISLAEALYASKRQPQRAREQARRARELWIELGNHPRELADADELLRKLGPG